jgi:mono/diheme cytochrome c family protein
MVLLSGLGPLIAKDRYAGNGAEIAGAQSASPKTQPPAPAVVPPPPPITDGPTLFRERGCVQCHEIRGVGGHKGPDLSGVGRRLKKDVILKRIEQGGDEMPAFGGVIAESDIAALVKYLEKCRDKPKGKDKAAPPAPAPVVVPAE